MIRGRNIALRTIREGDLDTLLDTDNDHERRGPYVIHRLTTRPALEKEFRENGLLTEDFGRLLIVDPDDRPLGTIVYFKPGHFMDAYELGYVLFETAERGRGITTEAVGLLADWLFRVKKIGRIQLCMVPENAASRRVAEKSGFQFEGVLREAVYLNGASCDLEMWSLLRREWEERRAAPSE
ncbi:MAG TPA: GNAT family protein [Thermoanaerobaculia bacterium]|nr:GNAT family protein [Thermoanaerobaculia bacterium]